MSSHLLPDTTAPSTPLNKGIQGIQDAQDTQDAQDWPSAASAVKCQLDQTIATQRQLFKKVKKGFQEQSLKLATARHQIELLQAQVNDSIPRKRKAVKMDPNTKFATIKEVREAQHEAGDVESDTDESSAFDTPSVAEECIVVASRDY
ncbi:putative transposase [Colletotrichum sublineola]|uniref:Putative transposase n=1 Tax=Colletotrichum sublineola TaxID=1173701 RepID=A0A066XQ24_COLSU|nr:putative transposase [Colletotrichum sublineola]